MIIEIRLKNGTKIELTTTEEPVTSDWLKALMERVFERAED